MTSFAAHASSPPQAIACTLGYPEVLRLASVLHDNVAVQGMGDFMPALHVKPVDLLLTVHERLLEDNVVPVRAVLLNGSAASFVVAGVEARYNDLDMIFQVDMETDGDFEYIRGTAVSCFGEAVRKNGGTPPRTNQTLEDMYVLNMVKVQDSSDRWSLISFRNCCGKNIELKFVTRIKRQFEFSVDSFHINLDSYLQFRLVASELSPRYFPTVEAVSLWRNFREALHHVRNRLIVTTSPETIRGGGLLKYCKLLVLGYRPGFADVAKMEQYMCSRFFIDLPHAAQVQAKLGRYLQHHFGPLPGRIEASLFLTTLMRVVAVSSHCLMAQDRQAMLTAIDGVLRFYCQPTGLYSLVPMWSVDGQHSPTPTHLPCVVFPQQLRSAVPVSGLPAVNA